MGQTRFFRPTGTFTTDENDPNLRLADFREIEGLGAKKPWNNADAYNLNLTVRGTPTATTRYNAGVTFTRDQRRFFDPQLQFRPYALAARREKSWLVRGGLEQVLYQGSESGATLRINIGYGQDGFAQGPLGETLADTLAVLRGDKYPMAGDVLGFTFSDFRFPFEGHFTIDKVLARIAEMKQDPTRNSLVPLETLIDPETGEPFTIDRAVELFDTRYGLDNPFGIQDYLQTGLAGYGWRTEKTLSLRADLDRQANRWNRIGIGAEFYKKKIENLTGFGSGIGAMSLVAPTFQNVYTADPIIAGFYAKDRLDLGEVVIELGVRVDYFDSDMVYPELPGFFLPVRSGDQVFTPRFVEQEAQLQFSPRLGVGFPVTENTQFRLSYGHFTQVPALNQLFSGVNADLNKVNRNATFGRPIEFGRTIGYEVGITHSFDESTVLDIAGYSREKQGDIAFRVLELDYPGVGLQTVRFLTNADFGYVRGADARLSRRFSQPAQPPVGLQPARHAEHGLRPAGLPAHAGPADQRRHGQGPPGRAGGLPDGLRPEAHDLAGGDHRHASGLPGRQRPRERRVAQPDRQPCLPGAQRPAVHAHDDRGGDVQHQTGRTRSSSSRSTSRACRGRTRPTSGWGVTSWWGRAG